MNLNYEQIEADIRFSLTELLSNELLANKLLSGNAILRYKDIFTFERRSDGIVNVYAVFPVSFSNTSRVLIAEASPLYDSVECNHVGDIRVTIKL